MKHCLIPLYWRNYLLESQKKSKKWIYALKRGNAWRSSIMTLLGPVSGLSFFLKIINVEAGDEFDYVLDESQIYIAQRHSRLKSISPKINVNLDVLVMRNRPIAKKNLLCTCIFYDNIRIKLFKSKIKILRILILLFLMFQILFIWILWVTATVPLFMIEHPTVLKWTGSSFILTHSSFLSSYGLCFVAVTPYKICQCLLTMLQRTANQ